MRDKSQAFLPVFGIHSIFQAAKFPYSAEQVERKTTEGDRYEPLCERMDGLFE
jgi:hypothetical protein